MRPLKSVKPQHRPCLKTHQSNLESDNRLEHFLRATFRCISRLASAARPAIRKRGAHLTNSRYISLGLSIFPLLFSDILYLPKPMKTGRLKNRKRIFRRPFYPVPVMRQARLYPPAATGAACTNRTAASDTIRQSAAYKMRWPNSAGCRN